MKKNDGVETANKVIRVTDAVLSSKRNFTGKLIFEVNCKNGEVISINAIEQKKVRI